jgi:hypothetical protein
MSLPVTTITVETSAETGDVTSFDESVVVTTRNETAAVKVSVSF